MGVKLRAFAGRITKGFDVKEHPKEAAARIRRNAANLRKKTTKGKRPAKPAPVKKSNKGKQQVKAKEKNPKKAISMSLLTYKLHALGDYVETIRRWGTTDSYNSQTVRIFFYPANSSNRLYRENVNTDESNATGFVQTTNSLLNHLQISQDVNISQGS